MDIFNPKDHQNFIRRLENLQPDQHPLWGKMTPAQMLVHCTAVQDACNGTTLQKTPFIVKLFKGAIKRSVLDDKPYTKGIPTHPQYRVTDARGFEQAKADFLTSLERFVGNTGSAEHSLFGTLSKEERSKALGKHHEHHWAQFGL
jgi:hypothetical protein